MNIFINPPNDHTRSHDVNFNDFDENVEDSKDMFHGRKRDDFTMFILYSPTADNHEGTFGTDNNDFGYDTGVYTNLYYGQIQEAFWLFDNSTETGNIAANVSGPKFDHRFWVKDEVLSNFDIMSNVED